MTDAWNLLNFSGILTISIFPICLMGIVRPRLKVLFVLLLLLSIVASRYKVQAAGEQAFVTFNPNTTIAIGTGQIATITLVLNVQPPTSQVSLIYGKLTESPDYEIVDGVTANGFTFFSYEPDGYELIGAGQNLTTGTIQVATITVRALQPGTGTLGLSPSMSFVSVDQGGTSVVEIVPQITNVPYNFTGVAVTPITEITPATQTPTPTQIIPTATPTVTPTPTDTPTPTPTIPPEPECDMCGLCKGKEIPNDYAECLLCLYNDPGDPTDPNNIPRDPKGTTDWTIAGCTTNDVGGFTQNIMTLATTMVGGIGFLIMLTGGYLILTSQGNSEKLYRGRVLLINGGVAIVLTIFGVAIYNFVGGSVLKIPGMG